MWGLCGRSIAGIRLYARNTGKSWSATAIAQPHHTPETYQASYIDRSTRVADLLGLDTALEPGDIDTLTGFAGTKYGVPTEAAIEAIHLVAKTEAIILDPNYTGKSMSAIIAQIRTRNLDQKTHNLHPHRRPNQNLLLPQPTLQLETRLNHCPLPEPSPFSQSDSGARGRTQRHRTGDAQRVDRTPTCLHRATKPTHSDQQQPKASLPIRQLSI